MVTRPLLFLSLFCAATATGWAGAPARPGPAESNLLPLNRIISAQALRRAGYLGQGVRVGVISGGTSNYRVLAKEGILPKNVVIFRGKRRRGDEGDWLMQVVHQIAPRARLAFCPVDVVACSAKLIEKFHAQVVVFDINWRTVSFAPLPVVRGLARLHRRYPRVLFFTGAGNFAGTYYTARWTPVRWRFGAKEVLAQDFGRTTGAATRLYDPFRLPFRNARVRRIVLTAAVRKTDDAGACPGLPVRMVLLDRRDHVVATAAAPEQGKGCGQIRLSAAPSQLPGLSRGGEYRVALVGPEKLRKAQFRIRLNGYFVAGYRHGSIHFRYAVTGTAGANAGPSERTGVLSVTPLDPNTSFRGLPVREFYGGAGPACYLPLDSPAEGGEARIECWKQPSISAPDQAVVAFPAANGAGYRYRVFHGGSNAGPVAGGSAALLLSSGIAAQKIPELLERTARPLAEGRAWNPFYGFGLVDVDAAARAAGVLHGAASRQAGPTAGNGGAVKRALVARAEQGDRAARGQLEREARSGNAAAALAIGEIFRNDGRRNRRTARFLWQAAQAGRPRAEYDLGAAFAEGWAAPAPDFWAALVWWQRAAEQGEARADCRLSEAYADHAPGPGKRRIGSPVPYRPQLALALADVCVSRGAGRSAEYRQWLGAWKAKLSPEEVRRAESRARGIERDPRRGLPSLSYEFVPRNEAER
jgi:hypothetical protein